MAYDLERPPGRYAVQRGALAMRGATVFLVLVATAAVLPLVLLGTGTFGVVSALALLGATLIGKLFFEDALDRATPWVKGGNAEIAVGELLNELRLEQYVVMHDLENVVRGNVDHFVAGATGVFMVETKFSSYRTHELGKAKAVAATIGHELGVWVTPVICKATHDYGPRTVRGVVVVGRRQLLPYIRSQRKPCVDFDRLARFADRQ